MIFKFFIILFLSMLTVAIINAQDDKVVDSTEFDIFGDTEIGFSLINEMPLTLNMEKEMELSEEAKDAQKRN